MTAKRFKLDDFDSEVEMWELLNIQAEVIFDLEKENEQLKQQMKIYKNDGLETLNDLERAYENNAKALSNIERLEEENKELKAKVDDKEVAVEVECEKLMHKVFDLIDNSLEKDKREYKMTYEDYLNGRIEALEELKKAMME